MAKSSAPQLARSPEGIVFLLLEGDDLPEVREVVNGANPCLPLGYLLGLGGLDQELQAASERVRSILSRLPDGSEYEAEDVSRVVATLREAAIARRTLEMIRDASNVPVS